MSRKQAHILLLLALLCLAGCKSHLIPPTFHLPPSPDYADTTQWYVMERGGAADLFYIISTETGDYTRGGVSYHHADTYSDSVRLPMRSEMAGVEQLLSGRLNYYSPYYRQCSLQSFTDPKTTAQRLPTATDDVRRAFRHYLKHLNPDRPFIVAGFSQGAMIVLQLLKEMDRTTYRRMVAAYVIGASVPQQLADNCCNIVPAKGAADTGVTICYNSVRDAATVSLFPKSAFAINPVNWHTDDTPATLLTEPTPFLPVGQQQKDTLTVRLDAQSQLLFVEGYTGTDYMLPLIGHEGNYHSREIWLYREQLRENMQLRTEAFLKYRK